MTLHFYFIYPETAGKTLEEVEYIFASKTPAWKTKVETKRVIQIEHGDVSDPGDSEKQATANHFEVGAE